jgi:hypothetical protein
MAIKRGRHPMRQVAHRQIAPVRPDSGAAAGGILRPTVAQRSAQALFRGKRRALVEPFLDLAGDRHLGARKGTCRCLG